MPVKRHRASDYLETQEDIVAYLNAAVKEMGDDPRLLVKAFRNVADARGVPTPSAHGPLLAPKWGSPASDRGEGKTCV
jgi:hypothetical protein